MTRDATTDDIKKSFRRMGRGRHAHARGEDHHAKVLLDLEDAYHGANRTLNLRVPRVDAHGRVVLVEHTLDELASSCTVSRQWIIEHVHSGVLPANDAPDPAQRLFSGRDARRARRLSELKHDFDANPQLADLFEELGSLGSALEDFQQLYLRSAKQELALLNV